MAICEGCGRDKEVAEGCTIRKLERDNGRVLERIPYRRGTGTPGILLGERCSDCGAVDGSVHHLGCDMEACPSCGERLISCGCL